MSDTTSSSGKSSNDDFSFKYTESGGLTSRYLLISFDSKTNTLTSSTDISGSNLSRKPISDSDKQELKETIAKTWFNIFQFEASKKIVDKLLSESWFLEENVKNKAY